MKNIFLLFLIVALFPAKSFSQNQKITTFILLRHAEKAADGSQDPELTQEGLDRASRLATLFKNTNIAAIYSTNYKRTRNTVAMLAKEKGLEVQTYAPAKGEELNQMLSQNSGKTIVVVGHSNTIPGLANMLIGKAEFENFPDSEYGNIFIISVIEKGKTSSVVRLSY